MYIGLGTLQTAYCILCKGAIILATSAPIILINNNNSLRDSVRVAQSKAGLAKNACCTK